MKKKMANFTVVKLMMCTFSFLNKSRGFHWEIDKFLSLDSHYIFVYILISFDSPVSFKIKINW